MRKCITTLILGWFATCSAFSQQVPINVPAMPKISDSVEKQTLIYSRRDTSRLGLDIYRKKGSDTLNKRPCILFVFGGAFIGGERDDSIYNKYFNALVENNYVVVSISYRLGLKGVQHLSKFDLKPLKNAVNMAVEDVYDATNWLIRRSSKFGIDTSLVTLSGSSSGAITVLTAEFEKRNFYPAASVLPPSFNYSGIISFSGAILSFNGALKFKVAPAPRLMFHGTADKIVPYKQIRFFNKGFYGSAWIARYLKEKNDSYYLYSEVGLGHEVSVLPMFYNIPLILDFLQLYVVMHKPYQTELYFKNPEQKPLMTLTPGQLLQKLHDN